ncbi:type II toxin-antitoxin system PemK/MazF family toxin [Desulfitibacter alkalitolerans]|uniref:type II toxin-antitoxin system PemK/MazF family toxin n=1 Tax=Desulfitibacter alkalitolerans TaxID=264641 RepID=UPI000686EE92|nr:type II toxin-antitoxin system PemK/MazF family toxin [Desulfitibacter alkalitolerans]
MKADLTKVSIRRGDIYLVNLGCDSKGRTISRPVLVIQNDIGNRFCSTVIVVPLIPETLKKKLLFSISIKANSVTGLMKDHVAVFSQIRTVDKSWFTNDCYLGRLNDEDREQMDKAIELSLGLSTLQKLQNRKEVYVNQKKLV